MGNPKYVAYIDLPPEKEHVYLWKVDKQYNTWLWTRDLKLAYRFSLEYDANIALQIATADFTMNTVTLTGSWKVKPEEVEANNMTAGHNHANRAGALRMDGPGSIPLNEVELGAMKPKRRYTIGEKGYND